MLVFLGFVLAAEAERVVAVQAAEAAEVEGMLETQEDLEGLVGQLQQEALEIRAAQGLRQPLIA